MAGVSRCGDTTFILKPWIGFTVFVYSSMSQDIVRVLDSDFPDSRLLIWMSTRSDLLTDSNRFLWWFNSLYRVSDFNLFLLDAESSPDAEVVGVMLGMLKASSRPVLIYSPDFTRTWWNKMFVGTDNFTDFRGMLEHLIQ